MDFAEFFFVSAALLNRAEIIRCANILARYNKINLLAAISLLTGQSHLKIPEAA
jgi:hypothetical protein